MDVPTGTLIWNLCILIVNKKINCSTKSFLSLFYFQIVSRKSHVDKHVDESTSPFQFLFSKNNKICEISDLCSDFNFYYNKKGYQGSLSPLLYFDLGKESFNFIAKLLVCSFFTRREYEPRESGEYMRLRFTRIHFDHKIYI